MEEGIINISTSGRFKSVEEILENSYKNLISEDKKFVFLSSGFLEYDRLIGGIELATNTIVGARPGMGKTAFGLVLMFNLFKYNTDKKIVTIFWNWEMTNEQQSHRLFSTVTKKTTMELKTSTLNSKDKELMSIFINQYRSKNIFFCDTPAKITDISSTVASVKQRYPDYFLVNIFDHTRLVQKEQYEKSEEERLFNLFSEGNKIKKMGCANIFLSQLNREVEKDIKNNGYRSPVSADLFGADAAQQFADVTLLLHRPSKYGMPEWDKPTDNPLNSKKTKITTINKLWLEVAKNRNGADAISFLLNYDPQFNVITDYIE